MPEYGHIYPNEAIYASDSCWFTGRVSYGHLCREWPATEGKGSFFREKMEHRGIKRVACGRVVFCKSL
jgi:hypothetical protein